MTNQPYYDCPLEAAYMAKCFGVTYYTQPDASDADDPYTFENEFKRFGIDFNRQKIKYYIHPDSLSTFEPQDGDMDNKGFFYDDVIWKRALRIEGGDLMRVNRSIQQIIQRNGKQFFWPKGVGA